MRLTGWPLHQVLSVRERFSGLPWASLVRYPVAFYPVALTVLYAKLNQMERGGFRSAGRYLGRIGLEPLTLWEKLSFFRADFFISCLAVPALLVIALRFLAPRWRPLLSGASSLIVFFLVFVQLKAFATVGTFLSPALLVSAAQFAIQHPEYASPFLAWSGLIKAGTVVAVIFVTTIWAARRDRQDLTMNVARSSAHRLVGIGIGGLLLGLIACSVSPLPRVRYHQSLLLGALGGYLSPGSDRREEFAHLKVSELASSYRGLVHAPERQARAKEWGRASGYDVIFFVLETVPARCLDLTGNLEGYPNLQFLRQHALIGEHHYSTYPYTSFALFSLLSSWYPPSNGRSFARQFPGAPIPGLVRALRQLGYDAGVFSPWRSSWEPDSEMFAMFGFTRQAYPTVAPTRGPWLDESTLESLRHDLRGWLAQNQRYLAVFLPQSTHGPWLDPDSLTAPTTNRLIRCRRLIVIQDQWLGKLLDELRAYGRLGRTIIVVTADHGVRTRDEDPAFVGGMVDEYSFHVPLLVYAPGVVEHARTIPYLTSHIDVVPTVLDLLGVGRSGELEQGAPIWDRRLAARTTFFFAGGYLGADGYHAHGQFYGWNEEADLVYAQASRLHFGEEDLVPGGSPQHRQVTELLVRISSLQQDWAARVLGMREATATSAWKPGSVTLTGLGLSRGSPTQ